MPAASHVPPDFIRMVKDPAEALQPAMSVKSKNPPYSLYDPYGATQRPAKNSKNGGRPSIPLQGDEPTRLQRQMAYQESLHRIESDSRHTEMLILKSNQKFAQIRMQFKQYYFPDELRFVLMKNFYEQCLASRKQLQQEKIQLTEEIKSFNAPSHCSPSGSASIHNQAKSRDLFHMMDVKGNFVANLFRKMTKKKSKLDFYYNDSTHSKASNL